MNDISYMRHALNLAARGLGNVMPNPAVGCVIVKDGKVVGRGWTQPSGRPHAETVALAQAGADAKGATLYVSLEPCAHHGQTPPCTDAIIASGIARVVVACRDTHAIARGGAEKLKAVDIAVTFGVCEKEARILNEGFFSVLEKNRPFVSVKLATSLDGKITTGDSTRRWLTNERSRAYGHLLRASHDAIITGIGTVLADDPALTCRLPGLEGRSPQRIVLDSRLRMPLDAKCLPGALILTLPTATNIHLERLEALTDRNAEVIAVEEKDGQPYLPSILKFLAERGITRVLVEAGAALTSAFLAQNLADRLYWFRAPVTVGEKGLAALAEEAPFSAFKMTETRIFGEDVLEVLERPDKFPSS